MPAASRRYTYTIEQRHRRVVYVSKACAPTCSIPCIVYVIPRTYTTTEVMHRVSSYTGRHTTTYTGNAAVCVGIVFQHGQCSITTMYVYGQRFDLCCFSFYPSVWSTGTERRNVCDRATSPFKIEGPTNYLGRRRFGSVGCSSPQL